MNAFGLVDVAIKTRTITTSACLAIFAPFDCVFYFTTVRNSFWITSLTQTPVCFPFHLFCSCASAFNFLTRFIQNLELRRFRGLMACAEVAVRRKHVRLQHHTAVTQPLTGHWLLQWKWSLKTFCFFNISGEICFSDDLRKEPGLNVWRYCALLKLQFKRQNKTVFWCCVWSRECVCDLLMRMRVCDNDWNGSKQRKHSAERK